jgi:hypothetical protein
MQKAATFVIPFGLQELPLRSIIDELDHRDSLLMGMTSFSRLLTRVERKEFIHLSVDFQKLTLSYILPRCNLVFEATKQEVCSREFRDFCVRESQILDGTLVGFTSYLILAHRDGREKVLIPSGRILENACHVTYA